MEKKRSDVDCERIFRFPEEERLDDRIVAMSPEQLNAWLETVDCLEPAEPFVSGVRQITELFSALDTALGHFLSAQKGKTDVFGRARDPEALYRDFCELQETLQTAEERLTGSVLSLRREAVPSDPRVDCVLEHMIGCSILPQEFRQKVAGIRQARERNRNRREAVEKQYEMLDAELRKFLRGTLAAYGERSLVAADLAHNGHGMQAQRLLSLIAELREAAGACLQRLRALSGSRAEKPRT